MPNKRAFPAPSPNHTIHWAIGPIVERVMAVTFVTRVPPNVVSCASNRSQIGPHVAESGRLPLKLPLPCPNALTDREYS